MQIGPENPAQNDDVDKCLKERAEQINPSTGGYQRLGRLGRLGVRLWATTAAITGGLTCRNAVHDKMEDLNTQRYHDGESPISDTARKVVDMGAAACGTGTTAAGIAVGSVIASGTLLSIRRRKWEKEQERKGKKPDTPEPPLTR